MTLCYTIYIIKSTIIASRLYSQQTRGIIFGVRRFRIYASAYINLKSRCAQRPTGMITFSGAVNFEESLWPPGAKIFQQHQYIARRRHS